MCTIKTDSALVAVLLDIYDSLNDEGISKHARNALSETISKIEKQLRENKVDRRSNYHITDWPIGWVLNDAEWCEVCVPRKHLQGFKIISPFRLEPGKYIRFDYKGKYQRLQYECIVSSCSKGRRETDNGDTPYVIILGLHSHMGGSRQ